MNEFPDYLVNPPRQSDGQQKVPNPFQAASAGINNGVNRVMQAGADHALGRMIVNPHGKSATGIAPSRQFVMARMLGSMVR